MADERAVFMVPLSTDGSGTYMVVSPHMVVTGFAKPEDAHGWLLGFFDMNARRAADIDGEARMDAGRLAIEREEMLARLLEPATKQ